jgi:hypothetical protein
MKKSPKTSKKSKILRRSRNTKKSPKRIIRKENGQFSGYIYQQQCINGKCNKFEKHINNLNELEKLLSRLMM